MNRILLIWIEKLIVDAMVYIFLDICVRGKYRTQVLEADFE